MDKLALGIDIGGTNTAFALVDDQGNVFSEGSIRTNNFKNPIDLVLKIHSDILNGKKATVIEFIGVGAPNGNSLNGTIEYAPNLNWNGIIPIKALFEEVFGKPCFLENDANAAAVGEKMFGCAKSYTDFVVLTLGTGFGSGLYINNQLVIGSHGFAGEYGHMRCRNNDRLCKCGRSGCLETIVSATGVKRTFDLFSKSRNYQSILFQSKKTDQISAFHIFEAAKKGDQLAIEIVDFTANTLGDMIADFAAISDPQSFVLFGGIAQSGDFFLEKVKESFKKNCLELYKDRVKIELSDLNKHNAAVLGMAAVAFYRGRQL